MIVIADLHLDRGNDSFDVECEFPFFKGVLPIQTRDVLTRLVEVTYHKETLIVAGDIFNRPNPSPQMITLFLKYLHWAVGWVQQVHLIPGNHDSTQRWVSAAMFEAAKMVGVFCHLEPRVLNFVDGSVVFAPHVPGATELVLDGINWNTQIDFVVSHGRWAPSGYDTEVFREACSAMDIHSSTVQAGTATWLLGHEHAHAEYKVGNRRPALRLIYPGSCTVNTFGEVEEDKGFLVVSKGKVKWKPFESEVTPWRHVTIDLVGKDHFDPKDYDLGGLIGGAIVKVTLVTDDQLKLPEAEIRKVFGQHGYVSRFETVMQLPGRVEEVGTVRIQKVDHKTMLKKHLTEKVPDARVLSRAIELGNKFLKEAEV